MLQLVYYQSDSRLGQHNSVCSYISVSSLYIGNMKYPMFCSAVTEEVLVCILIDS